MKIDDIARLAGVSKSAVSLAFNNKPGISEATRRHILDISRSHGYIPRTMSGNKAPQPKNNNVLRFVACKNTGIVTEHYESQPFFNELIHHVTDAAIQAGYSLVISALEMQQLQPEIEKMEQEQPSAGLMLLGTNLPAGFIESLKSIHPCTVILDTSFRQVNASFVSINNYMGGYQAARHLLASGHRSIGYVESIIRVVNFEQRKEGFLAGLQEGGLSPGNMPTVAVDPTLVVSQELFMEAVTAMPALPAALFCENDYIAISVIKSLQELQIRVPEQVAVIGFDDITEARIISPELTTIHVRKDILAKSAIDLLLKKISGDGLDHVQIQVNTELVVRKSC